MDAPATNRKLVRSRHRARFRFSEVVRCFLSFRAGTKLDCRPTSPHQQKRKHAADPRD
jgi:hypothetical protein